MNTPLSSHPRCILWASHAMRGEAVESILEKTIDEGRRYARRTEGTVVDVLIVRGVSRWADSFEALRDQALEAGCDAYARLEQHWLARDFDLLVTMEAQCLTRSAAVYDEIARRTLTYGARLYLLGPSCLIEMSSYRAAAFVRDKVQVRRMPRIGRQSGGGVSD